MNNKETLELLKVTNKINGLNITNKRVYEELIGNEDIWNIKENVKYMDKISKMLKLNREAEKEIFSLLLNFEVQYCYPIFIKTLYNTLVICEGKNDKEVLRLQRVLGEIQDTLKSGTPNLIKRTLVYLMNLCWLSVINDWIHIDLSDIMDNDSHEQLFHKRYILITLDKEVYEVSYRTSKLIKDKNCFKILIYNTPLLILDDSNNSISYYDWKCLGLKIRELRLDNMYAMLEL